ncbi:MAG: DUF3883 domain-containing protein [Anaerolineae bacterium]|nr:DUF3883 domain-containing protein [Anaerolineae bacterium]
MELPQVTELDELNRMLMAVTELGGHGKGCTVESVIDLCSSLVLAGRPANHKQTIRLCAFAGLLLVNKGIVTLTEAGREFLELNAIHSYELTDAQKQFVAKRLVLDGPWRSRARDLLLNFSPNYRKLTYEFAMSPCALPLRCRAAVHLFQSLAVIVETDGSLVVVPEYVTLVRDMLANRNGTTDAELADALMERRKLGDCAEEAVLEYERSRLRALGRGAEASLVRRISQLDAAAGYDIESYDGDKPLFDYDRFIEVKASQAQDLRFYWTANEYQVAKQRGERYWIYFVGDFRNDQADQIVPIMIQDPASRLSQVKELEIETSTYIVTQCGQLNLQPVNQQDIKGLLL